MKKKCPQINIKYEPCSPRKMKKSFSSTYDYFQIESKNKKRCINLYSGIKSISNYKYMNSNFISLSKEANIFTSKNEYIKNKRIQLFNNDNQFDNKNKTTFYEQGYKTNLFRNNNHIFYKTTIFRGGKYFFNSEKRKERTINKIKKNMPIEKMIDYLEQNEHFLKLYDENKIHKRILMEKEKEREQEKKLENNKSAFYQKILNKKDEILNLIIRNQINQDKNTTEIKSKSPKHSSTIKLNININESNLKRNNSEKKSKFRLYKKKKEYYPTIFRQTIIKKIPLIFPKILTTLNKLNRDSENSIKNITPNKIIKNIKHNTIDIGDKTHIRKAKLKKNSKSWSMGLDLLTQKKLYKKEEKKTKMKLKEELKEDIKEIVDEINNKQTKIKEIEKKINLAPLTPSLNKKPKNYKKQNPIELRLISRHEIENNTFNNLKIIKTPNKTFDLFNSNERLYYSWFRDKKRGDISKFMQKNKLTELFMYHKTKDKILKDKFMGDLLKKHIDKIYT